MQPTMKLPHQRTIRFLWYILGIYLSFETASYLWQTSILRSIDAAPMRTLSHWSDPGCTSGRCRLVWIGSNSTLVAQVLNNGVACETSAFSLLRGPRLQSFESDGLIPVSFASSAPESFCVGYDGPHPSLVPLFPLILLWFLWSFCRRFEKTAVTWLAKVSAGKVGIHLGEFRDTIITAIRPMTASWTARRSAYNVHLYGMLIKVFWSDGQLDSRESKVFEEIIAKMAHGAAPENLRLINLAMREAYAEKSSFREHAQRFRREVANCRLALDVALDWLISAAASNNRIEKKQRALLYEAADVFGIPRENVDLELVGYICEEQEEREMEQERARQAHGNRAGTNEPPSDGPPPPRKHPLAWAYRELQCAIGASEPEVKKRYREAMLTYHPDRLRSKGLPPDLLEHAHSRFLGIQKAYEALMV